MIKAKFFNFVVSGKAAATFRVVMVLSILISALAFTGVVAAGTVPGNVGS